MARSSQHFQPERARLWCTRHETTANELLITMLCRGRQRVRARPGGIGGMMGFCRQLKGSCSGPGHLQAPQSTAIRRSRGFAALMRTCIAINMRPSLYPPAQNPCPCIATHPGNASMPPTHCSPRRALITSIRGAGAMHRHWTRPLLRMALGARLGRHGCARGRRRRADAEGQRIAARALVALQAQAQPHDARRVRRRRAAQHARPQCLRAHLQQMLLRQGLGAVGASRPQCLPGHPHQMLADERCTAAGQD